jgi:serine protease Do
MSKISSLIPTCSRFWLALIVAISIAPHSLVIAQDTDLSLGELKDEQLDKKPAETVAQAKKEIAQAKDLAIAFRVAAKRMMPSVVTVLVQTQELDGNLAKLDLLEDEQRFSSVGSGVIYSTDGLVITNNHVVKDWIDIRVRLADGREYQGTDVRTDPTSDLAIFKISSTEDFVASPIGDSNELEIGDWVLAIGSPFSLDQTVSAGIISGKGRSLGKMVEGKLLQTDAAINPGNSGGALANLDGELIGINTAIATRTGISMGIGFAIPVSRVKWIAGELMKSGEVRRASMGVTVNDLPQTIADELELPVRSGVFIAGVKPGKPAAKAGLEIGDVLIKIDGQRVATPNDLRMIVEQLPIDQAHMLEIIRGGERLELPIQLIPRGS